MIFGGLIGDLNMALSDHKALSCHDFSLSESPSLIYPMIIYFKLSKTNIFWTLSPQEEQKHYEDTMTCAGRCR